MKVQAVHFNPQETQPYFRYWLFAIGAQLGDEVAMHHYIIWNNQQFSNFLKSLGKPVNTPLYKIHNGTERFSEYLKQLWGYEDTKLCLSGS